MPLSYNDSQIPFEINSYSPNTFNNDGDSQYQETPYESGYYSTDYESRNTKEHSYDNQKVQTGIHHQNTDQHTLTKYRKDIKDRLHWDTSTTNTIQNWDTEKYKSTTPVKERTPVFERLQGYIPATSKGENSSF